MIPILSDNPRTSFSCKYVTDYVEQGEPATFETNVYFDYDKLASHHEYLDNNESVERIYAWKEGEVYYVVSPGWRTDSETGERINFYNKAAGNREMFLKELDAYIYAYAGGEHILALALADKYEDFTYSEEKEEYTASFYYELYETDADVTLKFENDRLVYMSVSVVGGPYDDYVFTYDYTYGISITVPEYYLNLHLGENTRN